MKMEVERKSEDEPTTLGGWLKVQLESANQSIRNSSPGSLPHDLAMNCKGTLWRVLWAYGRYHIKYTVIVEEDYIEKEWEGEFNKHQLESEIEKLFPNPLSLDEITPTLWIVSDEDGCPICTYKLTKIIDGE